MKDYFAILILTTIANLILGGAVWLRNPSQRVNQHFGIFSAAVGAWTLSNGLVEEYAAGSWGIIWARTAFASASVIPLSFFSFVTIFPSSNPTPARAWTILWRAAGLSAFLLSFTPLIAQSTTTIDGVLKVHYGPLHSLFGLFFIFCLTHSLFLLARKLRASRGIEKLQARDVFLGVSLSILGGTITNLIIPLLLHSSRFSPYGPLFAIFMISMTAHAIVRHRLMNIRLVIRRGAVWIIALATSGGVLLALLWMTNTFVFPRHQNFPLWVDLSLVLLIAILFQAVRQWIQTSFDRYLYRESYDYQHIIREASRTIGSMLELTSLLNYVIEVIGRTIRPEFVSIYINNSDGTCYTRMAAKRFIDDSSFPDTNPRLQENSPLPALLSHTRTYLLREDIEPTFPDDTAREALTELARLKGEMALPVLHEEQLIGLVVVAPKLSGDAYFVEDLDLLSTLAGQAAIAIINAQLYQEVARVNEYVANIVATMESGVVAVGPNGKITLFNPSAERITGLRAVEVRSDDLHRLPAALAHSLEATLNDGQPRVQAETTIPDIVGRYTPVSCSTYALRDRLRTPLGAVAVFGDLTRLKELEGERRRAERLASFSALASGVAHEIKNPLVAIRTFAELLPERFTDEEFRGDFSKVVIREIQRIDDLVARLRGLAVPATQLLTPLDLREPIEDTLSLLRAQLEQKEIRVRRIYHATSPLISGDQAQLKQLFLNLFMNALEAMEPGGELAIQLHPSSNHGTPTVLANVSDTGSGIVESLLGKMFDPFVTTKPRGSGLGLAICRGIADAHGATIRAQNNPGASGSTIVVEFPSASPIMATVKT